MKTDELPIDPLTMLDFEYQAPGWSESISAPFSISPELYLEYAEQDLKENCSRSYSNALHNAKRAISCQVDSVLWALGLESSSKLNLPAKLTLFSEIGLLSPRVLRKVVKRRNLVEHNYERVDSSVAEDAVDIALLFVGATRQFSHLRWYEFELWDRQRRLYINIDWEFAPDGKRLIPLDHDRLAPTGLSVNTFSWAESSVLENETPSLIVNDGDGKWKYRDGISQLGQLHCTPLNLTTYTNILRVIVKISEVS